MGEKTGAFAAAIATMLGMIVIVLLVVPGAVAQDADTEEETHGIEHGIGAEDEVAFYGVIQDEGVAQTLRRALNFEGSTIECSDDGLDFRTTCVITGGGGGGHVIEDESVPLASQPDLNFLGAGILCINNATTTATECTVSGGGSTSSFPSIVAPLGTTATADVSNDILTLLVTGGEITITSADDPETLTFDFLAHAGTDITADLEEETHAAEHDENAADEIFFEDLGTACTVDQFGRVNGTGGVICYTFLAAAISNQDAGTDITTDLEEESHNAEHTENAADQLFVEDLGTACAGNSVSISDGSGGLDCAVELLETGFTWCEDCVLVGNTGGGSSSLRAIPTCNGSLDAIQWTGAVWGCGTHASGGSITVEVEGGTGGLFSDVSTFDFATGGFDVTEDPTGEVHINLDLFEFDNLTEDHILLGQSGSLLAVELFNCDGLDPDTTLGFLTATNNFQCVSNDYLDSTNTLWDSALQFDDVAIIVEGGATSSFEVPNAAGGRTVNVGGELTVDTTSETFNYHDGTEERVLDSRLSGSLVIKNATDTDDGPFYRVDPGSSTGTITLEEVCYINQGGSTTWTGQLREYDEDGLNGADTQASDSVVTGAGGVVCVTSFSNATFDNGDYIGMGTISITGTPSTFVVTWYYRIDP